MTDLEQQTQCSCAEVEGENPDCPVHLLTVEKIAAWEDWECLTTELDGYTARKVAQRALAFRAAQPGEGERVPLFFYDGNGRDRRLNGLAALIERNATEHTFSIVGAEQLAADLRALSTPPLPERLDREAVARIIDPPAWSGRDRKSDEWRRTHTIKKADAILALLPSEDRWRETMECDFNVLRKDYGRAALLIEQMREHIAEQITHAETRIADGIEIGATVWRIALEDIARENRAALSALQEQEKGK